MNNDAIHEQAQFAERILSAIPTDQSEAIRAKFAALGIPVVARCGQCDRVLDEPNDPLSECSHGECAACLVEFETGKFPPDLPPDELRAFVQPYMVANRELRTMIDRALAEAGPKVEHDTAEYMVLIGMQRLIRDGYSQVEAREKTLTAFNVPVPPDFPTIEELDEP